MNMNKRLKLSRFSNECTVGFPTCREFRSLEILGRLKNLPYTQMKSDLSLMINALMILLMLTGFAAAQPGRGRGHSPGQVRPDGPGPGFGQGQRPDMPFPGGPQFDLMASEMRFDSKVVKGSPYSATAVTENVQVLADGTRITNSTTAKLYRDSEGRVRRELTVNIAGPFVISGDPPKVIFINDVVSGTHYVLEAQRQLARKMPTRSNMPFEPPKPPADQLKAESLGKQIIEGIEAEGTRTTFTIPVGQIGNDRPIEVVSERWESAELNTVILSKHKDPRLGETTYRLTNINRSEPDKSLFEVPADYKIMEGGMPPGREGRPMGQGRRPGNY